VGSHLSIKKYILHKTYLIWNNNNLSTCQLLSPIIVLGHHFNRTLKQGLNYFCLCRQFLTNIGVQNCINKILI